MRSHLLTCLALALAYLTTPVSAELTASTARFLASDNCIEASAEAPGHTISQQPDDRGCDGPCRFCACAGYVSFVPPVLATPRYTLVALTRRTLFIYTAQIDSGYRPDIFRPPTA